MEFAQLAPILAYMSKLDAQQIMAQNGCSVTFQSHITLQLEWEQKSDTLSFYTSLIHPTVENKANFYATLLKTHLFGSITQNTFFALHEETDEIMLFHTCALHTLDEQSFFVLLENFVAQAEQWYQTLPQLQLS